MLGPRDRPNRADVPLEATGLSPDRPVASWMGSCSVHVTVIGRLRYGPLLWPCPPERVAPANRSRLCALVRAGEPADRCRTPTARAGF